MEIESWNQVPDGATVIEDTYNEVYTVFTGTDGLRYIRQIGWQIGDKPVPLNERVLDFEPNCMYDQPWYRIA
jgi:hypothetical protein